MNILNMLPAYSAPKGQLNLNGAGTAHGFGVAKDNKGNIYKVLF